MSEYSINLESVEQGGKLAELFCLRPKLYKDKQVTLRVKINSKWGGWKLRDDLVTGLGLEIGNTIVTTVSPLYTNGLSADASNIDFFASGKNIDWLLENKVPAGSVIDCQVRFSYAEVPMGYEQKKILKVSLIFEKGFNVIIDDSISDEKPTSNACLDDIIQSLTGVDGLS